MSGAAYKKLLLTLAGIAFIGCLTAMVFAALGLLPASAPPQRMGLTIPAPDSAFTLPS